MNFPLRAWQKVEQLWRKSVLPSTAADPVRAQRPGQHRSLARPAGVSAMFGECGYFGPVPVFTEYQCRLVMKHFRLGHHRVSPDWPKDFAVSDRFFYELARRPPLLELLKEVLGDDIVLWGASVVVRMPGEAHVFHTDIESSAASGGCVSLWIGLENASAESGLALVSHSHRVGRPIQREIRERGFDRNQLDGQTAVAWAREKIPEARVIQPAVSNGEALMFDGRLWHGSLNTTRSARAALLLQYAKADARIPIQKFGATRWPFEMSGRDARLLLVSGNDRKRATHPPPTGNPGGATPVRQVVRRGEGFHPSDAGWAYHAIFHGPTPNAVSMESHVSVLSPGHCPHPPHAHADEELLVILEGEAELLIAKDENPRSAQVRPVSAGHFAYYPAYQHHTIRNVSNRPVTYLMYRWQGPPREVIGPMEARVFSAREFWKSGDQDVSMNLVFESPTGYLYKLHAHVTEIAPGGGYAAHCDEHDVAIIVFDGEVETLDHRIGRSGSAYCAGQVPHGLKSTGTGNARYLVFEFHGTRPRNS
jgi:uncharacterized cupin superfamily protein